MERSEISHEIAARAGKQIVNDGIAAGLPWSSIAISCETTITLVIVALIKLSGAPDPHRFASEILDAMTERALLRIVAAVKGVPYEG